MKIRFRIDSWIAAEAKALGLGNPFGIDLAYAAKYEETPPADPGDVWRLHWHRQGGDGPVAGYAFCCPKCRHVHPVTTHNYCPSFNPEKRACEHSGNGSCWQWSGSAEEGTLSAFPSFDASKICGWHGWLRNGELVAA